MASPAQIAARAGYRAGRIHELVDALRSSKRTMTMKGHVWDEMDPHAASILQDANAREVIGGLASHLENAGIKELRPLSGGFESVVLDAGDRVAKFGRGVPRDVPSKVIGVLPNEYAARVGPFRVEVQRKVDVGRARPRDVIGLENLLDEQGWAWDDAAPDNMGFLEGNPVAIDGTINPSGVRSAAWPLRRPVDIPDRWYSDVLAPPTQDAIDEASAMKSFMQSLEQRPPQRLLDGLNRR